MQQIVVNYSVDFHIYILVYLMFLNKNIPDISPKGFIARCRL